MPDLAQPEISEAYYRKVSLWSIVFSPLFLLVPVVLWLCFRFAGVSTNWAVIGIGALGWIVALVLRFPVMFLVQKWPQKRGTAVMVSVSGPLEETVRLIAISITGTSFATALSLGQGWAAIEVVNTFVTVLAQAALFRRTDEKAMQAKQMLAAQSGGKLTGNPLWGIGERVFASGYHIGATLLIASNPRWVLVMIPFHSLFNYAVLRVAKKSMAWYLTVTVIVGACVFTLGWVLIH